MQITELQVTPQTSRGKSEFAFKGTWLGEARPRLLVGKGYALCHSDSIPFWNMGLPPRAQKDLYDFSLCPAPPPGTTPGALVACVRGRG